MKICAGFYPLLLLCICSITAVASEKTWIVFDGTSVDVVQQTMQDWGLPLELHQFQSGDALAVAQVDTSHLPALTRLFHDSLHRCGGFTRHKSAQEAHHVKVELEILKTTAAQKRGTAYTIDNPGVTQTMLDEVSEDDIIDVILNLSSFPNRYYNTSHGVDAAHWLRDFWADLTKDRLDTEVILFDHAFIQPSVILKIQGSEFPDEVIVLGAHLDSTLRAGQVGNSPGADDDASGIAVLTEVVRVIASTGFQPKRSLHFMGYAGEEAGLLGSEQIADSYQDDGVDVIGAVQFDMTNYQGSAADIYFMTDFTNGPQTAFMESLIDTYLTDLNRSTSQCGYPCSDHASWFFAGYPVSMPAEATFAGTNPNLHTTNDTIAVSGGRAIHAEKFARLGVTYVAELAKGESAEPGPVTHDARVDILTMGNLIAELGPCQNSDCPRDLNQDGMITLADLELLYPNWPETTCLGFMPGNICIK